jgi:hypothetical protein
VGDRQLTQNGRGGAPVQPRRDGAGPIDSGKGLVQSPKVGIDLAAAVAEQVMQPLVHLAAGAVCGADLIRIDQAVRARIAPLVPDGWLNLADFGGEHFGEEAEVGLPFAHRDLGQPGGFVADGGQAQFAGRGADRG